MSLPASASRWGRSRRFPINTGWFTGERFVGIAAAIIYAGVLVVGWLR